MDLSILARWMEQPQLGRFLPWKQVVDHKRLAKLWQERTNRHDKRCGTFRPLAFEGLDDEKGADLRRDSLSEVTIL